jgi:hypothetical protein
VRPALLERPVHWPRVLPEPGPGKQKPVLPQRVAGQASPVQPEKLRLLASRREAQAYAALWHWILWHWRPLPPQRASQLPDRKGDARRWPVLLAARIRWLAPDAVAAQCAAVQVEQRVVQPVLLLPQEAPLQACFRLQQRA